MDLKRITTIASAAVVALSTTLGVAQAKTGEVRPVRSEMAAPDDTPLVRALVSGLGIEGATVVAALDNVRAADNAAPAAALARQLGVSTESVQAALADHALRRALGVHVR